MSKYEDSSPCVATALEAENAKLREGRAWINWNGGKQPVKNGVQVVARFRDGWISEPKVAGILSWDHANHASDIVAYKTYPLAAPQGGNHGE